MDRDAVDTIRGYYYQFDYFILQLLQLEDENDTVCIEGVEDVDIGNANETTAVQCKYYSKTEYNHSVIAKPIRFMLKHYADSQKNGNKLQYRLYGNYSSGQDKLPSIIDVSFAKEKFFTYIEKGIQHELFIHLGIDDNAIADFLSHLTIDINALSFEEQEKLILQKIMTQLSCNEVEAENHYYNNALNLVRRLSIQNNIQDRVISKRDFLNRIKKSCILFDIWFLKFKGIKAYCQSIRRSFFSITNISPFERFFLIDCDTNITDADLKSLLLKISQNWSKLSERESDSFCPYVYLHNITSDRLIRIKRIIQEDSIYFTDGYDYKDSDFSIKSICRKATAHNLIKLKIINELEFINEILNAISITREIYQFFILKPYYDNKTHKHILIQIEETKSVMSMI